MSTPSSPEKDTASQPIRRPRAKITAADLENIARLIITRRLNERECCELLNIRPRSWYAWRERHENQAEFEGLLARVRASHIDALLTSIDEMGSPAAGNKRDWRAKAWQAERVFQDRFGQNQPQAPAPQPAISSPVVNVLVQSIYGGASSAPKGEVVDVPVKRLPAPSPEACTLPSGHPARVFFDTPQIEDQPAKNAACPTLE